MIIKQLSIFLENKPGHLTAPCQTLSGAGINILTMSLADTREFGILRLIIKDWEKAKASLENAGHLVKVTDVVALTIPDKPGGLAQTLDKIQEAGVSIEYMYAFTYQAEGKGAFMFCFDDPDKAVTALGGAESEIVASTDLLDILEA